MTLLAIVAIHTAANEPPKVRQVMNKIHRNVGAYRLPHLLPARPVPREQPPEGHEERGEGATSVAMNFVHHLANFRRLVCGCMDSYDSEQSHILQHFSSSTR